MSHDILYAQGGHEIMNMWIMNMWIRSQLTAIFEIYSHLARLRVPGTHGYYSYCCSNIFKSSKHPIGRPPR